MSVARDRLKAGYYNSLEKTVDNPGGMADFGHRTNFPLALKDVGDVAQELVDDNDATKAAILADNDATQAAIVADNDATQDAIVADNNATEAAIGLIAAAVAEDAGAAATAKIDAQTAEGIATAAAGVATNAASEAKRTVANNFPDRLDATGAWFTEAAVGDPGTVANPAGAAIVDVAGYGYEYLKANAQGQLFTKGTVSAANGKFYEVEAEVEWTVKGGAETPSFTVGLQGLDAAFASTGAQVQAALQPVAAIGVQTLKCRFGYAAPAGGGAAWPQPGASVWLRPYVLFNRKSDNSGAVTASTARVRRLTVRDVTAAVLAEIQAGIAIEAAASVTLASQAEAEAGVGDGLMSATRVGQAIDKLAAPVGAVIQSASSPGAKFLRCDGANYLKASYPALAVVLGDRYVNWSLIADDAPKASACTDVDRGVVVGGTAFAVYSAATGNLTGSGNFATLGTAYGVIKAATKYFAWGISPGGATRGLASSADGQAWAEVATLPQFDSISYSVAAVGYGQVGATNYLVALGQPGNTPQAYINYSADEGASWAKNGNVLAASSTSTAGDGKLLFVGTRLLVWVKGVAFKRLTAVGGAASDVGFLPTSVDTGNGLGVAVISGGARTTSNGDAWTDRPHPACFGTLVYYLGYIAGDHLFHATIEGRPHYVATPDFVEWRFVSAPTLLASKALTWSAVIRPLGATRALFAGLRMTFAHDPATQFPVPIIEGQLGSYIKAL